MKKTLINTIARDIFISRCADLNLEISVEAETQEEGDALVSKRKKEIEGEIKSECRVSFVLAKKFISFAEAREIEEELKGSTTTSEESSDTLTQ